MALKRLHTTRTARITIGAVLAAASISVAFGATQLTETGSSLLYPLFKLWAPAYAQNHGGIKIDTAATGSGTGIAQSTKGLVQMGASDAYLSNAYEKNPHMLNIPVAISSQMVNYNVPKANGDHLKLSGPVLAAIYEGGIRYWDDRRIKARNRGVNLPHKRIVPIHRADGSGDTFLFTQFLSKSALGWEVRIGYGTTVKWLDVQGAIGATGNTGMVTALAKHPYSIAYVGVSYKDQIDRAHLGEAMLKNRDGHFVLPTKETVPAAASMVPKTPQDERISLIFAPGDNSYPIINYEYVLVPANQGDPETAETLKSFLKWAVDSHGGNSMEYLSQIHFMPLPPEAHKLTLKLIDKIHG